MSLSRTGAASHPIAVIWDRLSDLARRFVRQHARKGDQRINWRNGNAKRVAKEVRGVCFIRVRRHRGRYYNSTPRTARWALAPEWAAFLATVEATVNGCPAPLSTPTPAPAATVTLVLDVVIPLHPLKSALRAGDVDLERKVRRLLSKCAELDHGFARLTEVYTQREIGRRLFVRDSALQNVPKWLRRELLLGTFELDIQNSQPVILNHLTGGVFAALASYALLTERERWLNAVAEECGVTRDAAKQYVLCAIFGAGFDRRRETLGAEPPAWVEESLIADIASARRKLLSDIPKPELELLLASAFQHNFDREENPFRPREDALGTWFPGDRTQRARWAHSRKRLTVAAWVLQAHELRAALACLAWCQEQGLNVLVFLHDGLYVDRAPADVELLNERVRAETALPVAFQIKRRS